MKLYSFSGSCGLATNIALAWTGKPYEVEMIQREDLASPKMQALNPIGKVPILDDAGWVLYENAAILNYIAEQYPDAQLHGDGTARGRAEVNRWLAVINADLHPAYKPLFGATAYLGDETAISKTKNEARHQIRSLFEIIDAHLADQNWLAGTRSIADPYLFVTLLWAGFVDVNISGLDNLQQFDQQMRADEGVQKALKEQQLG